LNIEGRKYNIDLDKQGQDSKKREDFKLYDEEKEGHISEMTRELKDK